MQGFQHDGIAHTGGPFDWLTPFALMTGLALVAGYALLGATWLVMKTEGGLQSWARGMSLKLLVAVTVFIGIVSLWVPFLETDIFQRWFTWPNLLYLSPVPLAVLVLFLALIRALRRDDTHAQPFLLTSGSVRPVLSRTGHQPVAQRRAAQPVDLGCVVTARKPGLSADRRGLHRADGDLLHRLQLLGLPRQSQ